MTTDCPQNRGITMEIKDYCMIRGVSCTEERKEDCIDYKNYAPHTTSRRLFESLNVNSRMPNVGQALQDFVDDLG